MATSNKDYIGIYIDYNIISVSYANIKPGKISVRNIFNLNVDYKIEGLIKPLSINNDFFNEKQPWVNSFKETFKKVKTETNNVIVSLSHNFSVTRFFSMPFVERKFWNKAIPIESKKHIPVAFDELGYDFYAIPIAEKVKLGVIFSVTQKKTTEFITQLLKECGLHLEAAEPVVNSFYRISEHLTGGKDTYFFIYANNDEIYTSLTWKKIPILYRYISFSKSPSFSERKSLDLKGSLMFLQRNIPETEVKDVFVLGDNIDYISSQVKKEIQIEPQIIDIKKIIEVPNLSFPVLISTAASLNYKVKTDYSIDISENQKSKRVIKIVNSFITMVTASVVSFFLLLYLINILRTNSLNNKISNYYSQMPEINEFENTPAAVIEDKVKNMSKISKSIRIVIQNRDYFTPKLAAIADSIPKDVWLKNIIYNNPPSVDPSVSPNIDMTMEGETYLFGDSKTYYLDYFVKELKKKKAFEIFNPPRGRIDYETKDPENLDVYAIVSSKNYKQIISKIKITATGKK